MAAEINGAGIPLPPPKPAKTAGPIDNLECAVASTFTDVKFNDCIDGVNLSYAAKADSDAKLDAAKQYIAEHPDEEAKPAKEEPKSWSAGTAMAKHQQDIDNAANLY